MVDAPANVFIAAKNHLVPIAEFLFIRVKIPEGICEACTEQARKSVNLLLGITGRFVVVLLGPREVDGLVVL